MFQSKYKNTRSASYIIMVFIIASILLLVFGTEKFIDKRGDYNMEEQKNTIQRFAVQCYASEGSYPPNLEYLEENYGLLLNREKYNYIYSVFASNIVPDIVVTPALELKKEMLSEEQ